MIQTLLAIPQFPGAVAGTARNLWDFMRGDGSTGGPGMTFDTRPDYQQHPENYPTPTPKRRRRRKRSSGGSSAAPYTGADWSGPELPESTWDYRGAAFGSLGEGTGDLDAFTSSMERAQQDMVAASERSAQERQKSIAEEAQRWQEYQAKLQEVQGAIQAGFMAAYQNIGKGFDDMLGSMAKSFAGSFISSLIGRAAGRAANWIVGAYSGGTSVGAGPMIDSGVGIEIDPSGMRPATYGLPAAQRANYARRSARW